MKATTPDLVTNLPADAQVSVFVWTGRRERCDGQYSRSFGLDHEAAQVYAARQLSGAGTSKVQVCAKWASPDGMIERRTDCRPSGQPTIRERNASFRKGQHFPDALAFLDVLDRAA